MNKSSNKIVVILIVFFSLAGGLLARDTKLVYSQTNTLNAIQLDVQVYDVDLSTDVAKINLSITYNPINLSLSQAINQINIVGEQQSTSIYSDGSNGFHGSSGMVDWKLSGDLGRGEYVPFEVYELRFQLTQVLGLNRELNISDFGIDRYETFARFDGSKEKLLSQVFNAPANQAPFWIRTFQEQEAVFYLTRKNDPSGLPVLFWLLILPTLACLLVLASTLHLGGRKNLGHRLTVYIAFLFLPDVFYGYSTVFAVTFRIIDSRSASCKSNREYCFLHWNKRSTAEKPF